MSLLGRSASFARFSLEGELPDKPLDFIAERIAAFRFADIDDTFEEYSIGWVSIVNMFDAGFAYASYRAGDYVVLSLRIDERRVAPAVLKKFVAKEEERVKKEQQLPRLDRAGKARIKERIKAELTKKAVPVPAVYDLVWNLAESSLMFFTVNKKAQLVLEDFFRDCFGLLLVQQIPYTAAANLLADAAGLSGLERITPDVFV